MPLTGTAATGSSRVASFWFVLTDTWHGEPAPHRRHRTCSRRLYELPQVTPRPARRPNDLHALLARTPRRPDDSQPMALLAPAPPQVPQDQECRQNGGPSAEERASQQADIRNDLCAGAVVSIHDQHA